LKETPRISGMTTRAAWRNPPEQAGAPPHSAVSSSRAERRSSLAPDSIELHRGWMEGILRLRPRLALPTSTSTLGNKRWGMDGTSVDVATRQSAVQSDGGHSEPSRTIPGLQGASFTSAWFTARHLGGHRRGLCRRRRATSARGSARQLRGQTTNWLRLRRPPSHGLAWSAGDSAPEPCLLGRLASTILSRKGGFF
jgi:hypothetical protein